MHRINPYLMHDVGAEAPVVPSVVRYSGVHCIPHPVGGRLLFEGEASLISLYTAWLCVLVLVLIVQQEMQFEIYFSYV